MIYRLLILVLIASSCDSIEDKKAEPVFEIKTIAPLDSNLTESSGIISINNAFYTHSDIGGPADLLQLSLNGSITNTLTYSNAVVKDWEDTAVDDQFIYLADIGNNLGNRTDLRIFKIARSDLNNSSATPSTISFSFTDQSDFGNGQYNQTSYDAEAIAVLNGQVFVFTKDWLDLDSKVYSFPNQAYHHDFVYV